MLITVNAHPKKVAILWNAFAVAREPMNGCSRMKQSWPSSTLEPIPPARHAPGPSLIMALLLAVEGRALLRKRPCPDHASPVTSGRSSASSLLSKSSFWS